MTTNYAGAERALRDSLRQSAGAIPAPRSTPPIGTMAPTANGVEIVPRQRGPQSRPRVAARALCTPGPEAYRNALEKAIDDMVQAFRTGLGLPEDWTPEVCAKRALESKPR